MDTVDPNPNWMQEEHGYSCALHSPPLFRLNNEAREARNVFQGGLLNACCYIISSVNWPCNLIVYVGLKSINALCIPKEKIEGCELHIISVLTPTLSPVLSPRIAI